MDPKETKIPLILLAVGIAMYFAFGLWLGGAGVAAFILGETVVGLLIGIVLAIVLFVVRLGASFAAELLFGVEG